MVIKIWIFMLLMSSLMFTESRICQCQCCRYMGLLNVNSGDTCTCSAFATDEGKPFLCGGSTEIFSARICSSKVRMYYDPNVPNLYCQLKFVR